MIMPLEPFFVVSIEVIEASPCCVFGVGLRVVFEVDVRRRGLARNQLEIRASSR
jgi:hypothetical protein